MRVAVAGATGTVGRRVVEVLQRRGHDAVALSRRTGVDVLEGDGLAAALSGADVVIDVLNSPSTRGSVAERFFVETSQRLQREASAQGASHLVTLSIVGIDRVAGYGYYRAKVAHERTALAGPLPVTVLRATQFHEFAGQLLATLHVGPVAAIPDARVQPVAAATVAEHLVDMAEQRPGGTLELAGPEVHSLVDLARRTAIARHQRVRVVPLRPPGRTPRAMQRGALLPGPQAIIDGPTFDEWLSQRPDRT